MTKRVIWKGGKYMGKIATRASVRRGPVRVTERISNRIKSAINAVKNSIGQDAGITLVAEPAEAEFLKLAAQLIGEGKVRMDSPVSAKAWDAEMAKKLAKLDRAMAKHPEKAGG